MNTLITPEEMAERLVAMVKEHAKGDPEAEVAIIEYLSHLFFEAPR
jgi:hypothetical protein